MDKLPLDPWLEKELKLAELKMSLPFQLITPEEKVEEEEEDSDNILDFSIFVLTSKNKKIIHFKYFLIKK